MPAVTSIGLSCGQLQLELVPSVGGAVASLAHDGTPLLRPWNGSLDPVSTACFPLVPWSGRISGGGVRLGGEFHALAANWLPEPFPIHGDGWQRPWSVETLDDRSARLVLPDAGVGPWRYRAALGYRLDESSLTVTLEVEHQGDVSVPYGIGFHPWFPRTSGTSLRAGATDVWLEDERYLPTERVSVASRPAWDFSTGRILPESWINNVFEGWDGRAEIIWPERHVSLRVEATRALDRFLVYSPAGDADFFCFEPISHPVDAFNLPDMPGLRLLAPGGRLEAGCRLTVRTL